MVVDDGGDGLHNILLPYHTRRLWVGLGHKVSTIQTPIVILI